MVERTTHLTDILSQQINKSTAIFNCSCHPYILKLFIALNEQVGRLVVDKKVRFKVR